MKNRILKILMIVSVCTLCISNVFAENFFQFNEKNPEELKITEDLEDTYIGLANNVDIDSKVDAISMIMASKLRINGQTEYLVSISKDLEINGVVEKETYAVGNKIDISRDARLGENAYLVATLLRVEGKLDKKLFAAGERIEIDNAEINGDVYLVGTDISIGENVKVNGTVTYYGNAETKFDSKSDVKVNFIKSEMPSTVEESKPKKESKSLLGTIMGALIIAIQSVLAYIIIVTINEKFLDRAKEEAKKFSVLTALGDFALGLLFLIIVPIISLFLILLATKVSIIITAVYTIIILLSNVFFAAYVAQTIDQTRKVMDDKKTLEDKEEKQRDGFSIILTIFILSVLFALPYIGSTIELISLGIGITLIIKTIMTKEAGK